MNRKGYKLFSPAQIGALRLPNRLVRSSTWDPAMIHHGYMLDEIEQIYRQLALGGVGLIITGGLPVATTETLKQKQPSYAPLHIQGFDRLPVITRQANPDCKIIAQLESGHLPGAPSEFTSPFGGEKTRALSVEEIKFLINCFAEAIDSIQEDGYDGVQLHAAHGGALSCFLSPYTNQRQDEYGGSWQNRVRILQEIVSTARKSVGDFPILVKINATDHLKGGIDLSNFAQLAQQIEAAGFDAIEISGGMWDCLLRPEKELGFPPVPAPESHTRINKPEQQSYYLPYAKTTHLSIPTILVGGNRDVERLESILQRGEADFIALCRPLIYEPDLPRRWLEGRGNSGTGCISCNACIYSMLAHPCQETPAPVGCTYLRDPQQYKAAQSWLKTWVSQFTNPHSNNSNS